MAIKKRIYICCGTGIATSTVIARKLNEVLKQYKITADVSQYKLTEVASRVRAVKPDLVISATQIPGGMENVPVLLGRAFLTGVNKQQLIADVVAILEK